MRLPSSRRRSIHATDPGRRRTSPTTRSATTLSSENTTASKSSWSIRARSVSRTVGTGRGRPESKGEAWSLRDQLDAVDDGGEQAGQAEASMAYAAHGG